MGYCVHCGQCGSVAQGTQIAGLPSTTNFIKCLRKRTSSHPYESQIQPSAVRSGIGGRRVGVPLEDRDAVCLADVSRQRVEYVAAGADVFLAQADRRDQLGISWTLRLTGQPCIEPPFGRLDARVAFAAIDDIDVVPVGIISALATGTSDRPTKRLCRETSPQR